MESVYPELALCGSTNECARTDPVFFCISEVNNGTVSLSITLYEIGHIAQDTKERAKSTQPRPLFAQVTHDSPKTPSLYIKKLNALADN